MASAQRFFIPRPDRRLGDKYQLLECLGDGTYGWVWKAERLKDQQIVALKIPKAQGGTNKELEEGGALIDSEPHPNLVQVYWMGRVPPEREWYVIEMEYFPSATLAELLEREGGLVTSYEKMLHLYQQVLEGVDYLHSIPMIHGDIKPQNILVSQQVAKLTDFGSSVLPDDMYARTRENGGTILYSAPEIVGSDIRNLEMGALIGADIYSLGVLLYHLLTSALPHDTLSQVARDTPFPRPREINSSVCPALEYVVLRALAHDPSERWWSVGEMKAELQKAKNAQLAYCPLRPMPRKQEVVTDWSSHALALLEKEEYGQAEQIARVELEKSDDPYAFLIIVRAAIRDGRYFDCMRDILRHPKLIDTTLPPGRELRMEAIDCCLQTRDIDRAEQFVEKAIRNDGECSGLLFRKASILALQTRYEEAKNILLELNRNSPRKPSILKRLVLVCEQLRDTGKAAAFLRGYLKEVPDDPWATTKLEQFEALGLM